MNQQNPNAVATLSSSELAEGTTFSPKQVDLIREQIADGATDDELMLFLQVASSRGLDPFRKHIYAVSRYDSKKKRYVVAHQVSIDGLRLIAERSGRYEGQTLPQWCGPDGQWREVWLEKEPPAAAKVGVYIKGAREPLYAIALYRTFVQTTKEGNPTRFWKDMPEHMLAKVAESQALRKAFPEDAGGLYTTEEMAQATPAAPDASADVIDVQARPTQHGDPELNTQKRQLWTLANETFGWDHETLDLIAVDKTGQHLSELDTAGLKTLWQELVTTGPDERQAMVDAVLAPQTGG